MSERATLSLLDDGKFVLGVPAHSDINKEAFNRLQTQLKLWSFDDSNFDLLVFPFPVDVVDLRTKHEQPPKTD